MLLTGDVLGEIGLRLVVALGLGGVLGLERSYHGRPAGFRTHALVGLASSALMMVSVYESLWFHPSDADVRSSVDPTRMAQGLMTGIGFLGAGVIMKEGLSVRGLTTAASIWITAGIGILVGVGLYLPGALTTALALGALAGFRWIERRIRTEAYAAIDVKFAAASAPAQTEVLALVSGFGFSVRDVSHRFARGDGDGAGVVAYGMRAHSLDPTSVARLSSSLRARPDVVEFAVVPAGD